jgi:hypothetical protein
MGGGGNPVGCAEVGRGAVVVGISLGIGEGEISVGKVTGILPDNVATKLVGGSVAVVVTWEVPPVQAEINIITPRRISIRIRIFCKVDLHNSGEERDVLDY